MAKLLAYLLIAGYAMLLQVLQLDQELAMHALFEAKHAVNRAAHAAAQQVDKAKLARGVPAIDSVAAAKAASVYLRENLRLDSLLRPTGESWLRSPAVIVRQEILPEWTVFPYTYVDPEYNYEVTLSRPGVILLVRIEYPRVYPVIGPIVWTVAAAHELTYPPL